MFVNEQMLIYHFKFCNEYFNYLKKMPNLQLKLN